MEKLSEILWVDTETGGVDEKKHALVQLSAIIEIDGKEIDSIDLKMKQYGNKTIEQKALQVQNRTIEDIATFDDPIECFNKFKKFLARRPASKQNRYIMAGYNADFDCRFISEWYKDITGGPFEYWDYMQFSPIDILPTLRAMRHYGIISSIDTRLETMCKLFGIELNAHDSMSDIRATMNLTNFVYKKLFQNWTK